jgi:hypothetical protein
MQENYFMDDTPTIQLVIVDGHEYEVIKFGDEGAHYEDELSSNLVTIHKKLKSRTRYPRTIEQMKNEKMCLLCWALEGQYHHPTCVGMLCPNCDGLAFICDCNWSGN